MACPCWKTGRNTLREWVQKKTVGPHTGQQFKTNTPQVISATEKIRPNESDIMYTCYTWVRLGTGNIFGSQSFCHDLEPRIFPYINSLRQDIIVRETKNSASVLHYFKNALRFFQWRVACYLAWPELVLLLAHACKGLVIGGATLGQFGRRCNTEKNTLAFWNSYPKNTCTN